MTWSSLVPSRLPTSCNSVDQTLERCVLSLGPLPPLVPPFKATFKLSGLLPDLPAGPSFKETWPVPASCTVEPCVPNLPAGAKLVRTIFLGGSGSAVDSAMPCASQSVKTETENEAVAGRRALQIFGIPWTPHEFVYQAALRKRPRDLVQLLPGDLSDVVGCN